MDEVIFIKVVIKPVRVVKFIDLDFTLLPSGVDFDNKEK
jgi:hypothetical protein